MANSLVRSSLLILTSVSFALLAGSTSFAVGSDSNGTSIEARVCGVDQAARIVIDRPVSDSTFAETKFDVEGSVNHIAQIEFYVDGSYDQTVAIAANQSTFTARIATDTGTHTIKATGYGICDGQSVSASTIITINPSAVEGETDTTQPSAVTTVEDETSQIETLLYEGIEIKDIEKTIPYVSSERLGNEPIVRDLSDIATDYTEPSVAAVTLQKSIEVTRTIVFTAAVTGLLFQGVVTSLLQLSAYQSKWLIGTMALTILGSLIFR